MIRLEKSLLAWGTPGFEAVLKQEIAQLGVAQLPLQQGLTFGSYVTADPVTVVIHSITGTEDTVHVRVGLFYQSVVSGCSCENDPTPISENTEYCEVQLEIDRATAATTLALVGQESNSAL